MTQIQTFPHILVADVLPHDRRLKCEIFGNEPGEEIQIEKIFPIFQKFFIDRAVQGAVLDDFSQSAAQLASRQCLQKGGVDIRPFRRIERAEEIFTPSKSIAVFPPIAESTCDKSVVGT